MEMVYKRFNELMKTKIRLTPFDPKKKLTLVIDGASSVGIGIVLLQIICILPLKARVLADLHI